LEELTHGELLRGDNHVYALIRDDQKIVKMDASTAKRLYEYYNKYVDLMKDLR